MKWPRSSYRSLPPTPPFFGARLATNTSTCRAVSSLSLFGSLEGLSAPHPSRSFVNHARFGSRSRPVGGPHALSYAGVTSFPESAP
jgi:hypothetical protein